MSDENGKYKKGEKLNVDGMMDKFTVGNTSDWNNLVGEFRDLIHTDEYPITYARMATLLAPLKKENGVEWLNSFYWECKKKDNPSKYFWWAINPENTGDIHIKKEK